MSPLKAQIERLVRHVVTEERAQAEPEQARQARLIVYIVLIITGAALSYALVYAVLGMMISGAGASSAVILAPLTLKLFMKTRSLQVAGHMMALTSMVALSTIIVGTGGLESSVMAWSVLAPTLATMLAGRKAGVMWLGAVLAFFGVMWALHGQPWMPASEVPAWFVSTYDLIVPAGLVFVLFVIAWSYESARDEALSRISQANLAMRQARDEARYAHGAARMVLDNVAQGLALVRPDGTLTQERSAQLDRWFGAPREAQTLWGLLAGRSPRLASWLEVGWQELESDWMPLELTLGQLPSSLELEGQQLAIAYQPVMRGESLEHVLVVMTDVTEQVEAQRAEEAQRELMSVFFRFLRDAKGVHDFIHETESLVLNVEQGGDDAQERRWIHTLKGNSGLFGLHSFARWLHQLEDELAEQASVCTPTQRAALRSRWDEIKEGMAPLMQRSEDGVVPVERGRLEQLIAQVEAGAYGERVAREMRRWTWDSVPKRLELLAERARTLAQSLGKPEVDVRVEAGSLWQPPHEQWRAFWSASVHVIRNAIDHGVESAQARQAAGKPAAGQITLRAREDSGRLIIEIADDGRGIDWAAVARKAAQLGLPAQRPKELEEALFADGLSTRDQVSEVSGRGVGMQAAREACEALGGYITIETASGQGTTFRFVFPNKPLEHAGWMAAGGALSAASEVSEALA